MFTVIGLMCLGIGVGYLLRGRNLHFLQRVITALIWVLLFLLGIEVGSNETIVRSLGTLGAEAVILALGGLLGSVLAACALWKYLSRAKKSRLV
jgi:uncharacterized membrane protein YbjE (DUF340 family)